MDDSFGSPLERLARVLWLKLYARSHGDIDWPGKWEWYLREKAAGHHQVIADSTLGPVIDKAERVLRWLDTAGLVTSNKE